MQYETYIICAVGVSDKNISGLEASYLGIVAQYHNARESLNLTSSPFFFINILFQPSIITQYYKCKKKSIRSTISDMWMVWCLFEPDRPGLLRPILMLISIFGSKKKILQKISSDVH